MIRNVEMFSKPEFVNERETREKKKKGGRKKRNEGKKLFHKPFKKVSLDSFALLSTAEHSFNYNDERVFHTHIHTRARARVRNKLHTLFKEQAVNSIEPLTRETGEQTTRPARHKRRSSRNETFVPIDKTK